MIEAAIYLVIVVLMGGIGVRIGMILAGRIDRRMNAADADSAEPPPTEEPS